MHTSQENLKKIIFKRQKFKKRSIKHEVKVFMASFFMCVEIFNSRVYVVFRIYEVNKFRKYPYDTRLG